MALNGLLLIAAGLVFVRSAAIAVEIDPSRLPASGWIGNVGIPGGIPTNYDMFCNVVDSIPGTLMKAVGDGRTDDYPAIEYAIQHCPDRQYVYIPAGNYRLSRGIERRSEDRIGAMSHPFSIEIKGDGPGRTILDFYGTGTAISFLPANGQDAQRMVIVDGDARGSTSLRLDSMSSYLAPELQAVVRRVNANATMGIDPAYMKDTASQIVTITAVNRSKHTIKFTPALNEAYAGDFLSVGISPPFRCGIQDLSIENKTNSRGHNIRIAYGQECWIANVESAMASKWHIRLENCSRCEVRECYVHDGWNGGGDSIYGVGLFQYCCNNLVEDNVAVHCRHSYITEYGGQGNVFGYNFSRDPINESQMHTDYLMGDLIHHGGEPRWNLWEGNVASDIRFDCVLGGSAFNTAFRNLLRRKGLPSTYVACFGSDIQKGNLNENLVGNVYEPSARSYTQLRRWGTRQDDASVIDPRPLATAMLDGECDVEANAVKWIEGPHNLPDSYYLAAKPEFFGELAWPPIDPTHPENCSNGSIPAGRRDHAGSVSIAP
jgi:hypothetical protein